jgi:hypothetical protein
MANQTAEAASDFDDGLRGFEEGTKVLITALDQVAGLHPFIGVAVLAFKAVGECSPRSSRVSYQYARV